MRMGVAALGALVCGLLYFTVFLPCQAISAPANGLEIVDLRIDSLKLGLPAEVRFRVAALRSLDSVHASISDLYTYEVLSQPAMLTQRLAQGETAEFSGTILADSTGHFLMEIQSSGTGEDGENYGAVSYLYLIVDSSYSKAFTLPEYVDSFGVGGIVAPYADSFRIKFVPGLILAEVDTTQPSGNDDTLYSRSPMGSFQVVGHLYYQHPADTIGVFRPLVNMQVEIWDDDVSSGDDLLRRTLTDTTGFFDFGVMDNDDGCLGCGKQDVYLVFRTTTNKFTVYDQGWVHWWYTGVWHEIPDGFHDFGNINFDLNTGRVQAIWIFEFMSSGWSYAMRNGADPGHIACQYPIGDTGSAYASGAVLFIGSKYAGAHDIVLHEYAHAIMYRAYDNWFPPYNGGTHYMQIAYNDTLAWGEGWADFFPLAVRGGHCFNWVPKVDPAHCDEDLEVIWRPFDEGPACEGRVSAALLDLVDLSNDDIDENSDFPVSFYQFWTLGLNAQRHYTFQQFWDHIKHPALTYPEAYRGVRSVANNTIYFTGVIRGDCNADNSIDVSDVLYLQNRIFIPGAPPAIPYELVGDANCDLTIDICDMVYLIQWFFAGGPPPCTFE